MKLTETISTTPIQTKASLRTDEIRALTTGKAGKIIPVAFAPLLREDRVSRGNIRISLDMSETVHPLMNAVNVTAYAHFIPFLAFERFESGMESFNRSYQGVVEPSTGTAIPFFKTINFDRTAQLWKTLGVHWKNGQPINDALVEAYNVLVNFRRKARSPNLPLRTMTDTTLAAAFWKHNALGHIVPSYDPGLIDGQVPLLTATQKLPLKSKHSIAHATSTDKHLPLGGANFVPPTVGGMRDWTDEIFVELKGQNTFLSLANIDLARKTAAFARMRQAYQGLDDDHLIDLLMEGIRVPDEALKQPILLDKKSTVFGYDERHAMDGANLDTSVTTGSTTLDLTFRTPAMNTGGLVLVTVEIVPEQMHERIRDTFLGTTSPSALPNHMRDILDPEPVEVVLNNFADVEHASPGQVFGYAPLNHAWKRNFTRAGGRYYRPNPDAFSEDRQRFWAVEQLNPTLTADFYLTNDLPHTVFLDQISDPFELLTVGRVDIIGNTVFGPSLDEDVGAYDAVISQVDTTRIAQ